MLAGTPDPHMLPGRGLGHPKLGPMGARSSSEPAASLLKEAQAGPCPGAGVGRPFPRSCLEPSLSGASRPPASCSLLPPTQLCGRSQEGDIFHTQPFPLRSPAPGQRFIPGPRLVALGAGRAQGGADGPIMDRAAAPLGPVPPEPRHPSGAAGPGSVLTRPSRSPSGPPGASHRLHACFRIFQSWASPARPPALVGKAWGVGSEPAWLPLSSPRSLQSPHK